MAEMSNYLEDNLLDHVLRGDTGGTSFTQPTTIYLAFHTANPTDAASGAEVAGGSYARQLLSFGAASGGSSTNSSSATYTNMPTATVTHIALWDAVSGGNMLFHSPITSIGFNSGDEATVNVGAITVQMD
jgi:hypothetical protein